MSIRDIIHKMPGTRKELSDYILTNYSHIREAVGSNRKLLASLEASVEASFDKYSKHLGGISGKISGAGHAIGYAADAWLLGTGDIVGSLGGKYLNLLAQIPEKSYALVYGVSTGNYLDAAQNILEGAISYIPGLTFVDQGLERIIKKRMVREAVTNFEKGNDMYKPWTTRLSEYLTGKYTDVRDRTPNLVGPSYRAATA
ncbi:hypothetical protein HY640_04790 [Candidatus Woesearchaeota archaeon]|nr:hypothetical protein [Candidatus Woesearchaeota archaeon]